VKKITCYILFTLIVALLSLLIIRPILINKALLNNTVKQNVSNISSWKTYQLDKQYKNAALHFKLSYPPEWLPKEERESVVWYSAKNQNVFTVSWLNPDLVYDVEGICRTGMCNKIAEVSTVQNVTIEISKPTPERQKAVKLTDTFLLGEIVKSNKIIVPIFSTEVLSVNEFKTVLVTFSFTD
jgi:hypothetical protein